jgi:hypothetical protein
LNKNKLDKRLITSQKSAHKRKWLL